MGLEVQLLQRSALWRVGRRLWYQTGLRRHFSNQFGKGIWGWTGCPWLSIIFCVKAFYSFTYGIQNWNLACNLVSLQFLHSRPSLCWARYSSPTHHEMRLFDPSHLLLVVFEEIWHILSSEVHGGHMRPKRDHRILFRFWHQFLPIYLYTSNPK